MIYVYNKELKLLGSFPNRKAVCDRFGVTRFMLSKVFSGAQDTAKGLYFFKAPIHNLETLMYIRNARLLDAVQSWVNILSFPLDRGTLIEAGFNCHVLDLENQMILGIDSNYRAQSFNELVDKVRELEDDPDTLVAWMGGKYFLPESFRKLPEELQFPYLTLNQGTINHFLDAQGILTE